MLPAPLVEAATRAAVVSGSHLGAAAGGASSAAVLAAGVLKAMFWSKLRIVTVALLIAGFVVTGSVVGYHRTSGRLQAVPARTKQAAGVAQQKPLTSASLETELPDTPGLNPRTKSRIALARQIRDDHFRLWQGGEADMEKYLLWQRRLDDLIETEVVPRTTGAARVKYWEEKVKRLERLEQTVRKLFEQGQVPRPEVRTIEFYRLEAEEKLERARTHAGEPGTMGNTQ
jgi:hypothetical protein